MGKLYENQKINKNALLRISIGIIYLWFGILKFFPNVSPAEDLAKTTISILTFGLVPNAISYSILAIWEVLIGLFLLFNLSVRKTIIMALFHMLGTFTPLFILSDITFAELPTSLTLTGQYIMKNLIIISALLVIMPERKKEKAVPLFSLINFKLLSGKITLLILIIASLLLISCEKQHHKQLESLKTGDYFHDNVKKLTDIIVHDIFSPPVASRIYAYANIAAYECLASENDELHTLAGQSSELHAVPQPESNLCNHEIAALKAFIVVGRSLIFSEEKFNLYEKELFNKLKKEGISKDVLNASLLYGEKVAKHILEWADKDNYKQTRTFPKYTVTDDKEAWKPTPPDYMDGIEPHWNKLRTFIIDSASQFIPIRPTKFELTKDSEFYKEILEVYNVGKTLSKEQEDIAKFWDCNPYVSHHKGHVMFATKKITPGGHWIGITSIAAKQKQLNFKHTVEVYTRVSIALADAFISCWDEKYRSILIRPETLINEHIDGKWKPLLQTPPFPEYTSGHSVVSGAASMVLTDYFGENFHFIDTTEVEYGLPLRTFDSFKAAADEAAISRLYGGIHYMPAIKNGVDQGRKVGSFIINHLTTSK